MVGPPPGSKPIDLTEESEDTEDAAASGSQGKSAGTALKAPLLLHSTKAGASLGALTSRPLQEAQAVLQSVRGSTLPSQLHLCHRRPSAGAQQRPQTKQHVHLSRQELHPDQLSNHGKHKQGQYNLQTRL